MEAFFESYEKDINHLTSSCKDMSKHYDELKKSFTGVVESANTSLFKSKATVALDSTEIDRIIKNFGELLTNLKKVKLDLVNEFEKFEAPFRNHAEKVNLMQTIRTLNSNILDGSQTKTLFDLLEFGPTKWKLLYSGSRDGFGSKDFHSRCDNEPATLTIIKSENGNIFGGYTEAAWSVKNGPVTDPRALLFSLVNVFKTPCKMKNTGQNAIVSNQEYGPVFGNNDIFIANNSNVSNTSSSSFPSHYQKPANVDFGKTFFA